MKSSEVINHILSLPKFKKLQHYNETTKLVKDLLPNKRGILFAFMRHETLFIATKERFELKHDNIVVFLKKFFSLYVANTPNTSVIVPQEIKFYIPKLFLNPQNIFIKKPNTTNYHEPSKGEFQIITSNEKHKKILEEIKELIIKNANK